MLISAKAYHGYTLLSRDGEIGSVKDLLFDENRWTVRFISINTGLWPWRKQVLISPHSVSEIDPHKHRFVVKLSKDEIKESPDLDQHKPVSRHFEQEFYDHYNWPYYWQGPNIWGPVRIPGHISAMNEEVELRAPQTGSDDIEAEAQKRLLDLDNPKAQLHAARDVEGYDVQTQQQVSGHVDDFIIDEESWQIRYLVIDTSRWFFGKKVLLATELVDSVDWFTGIVNAKVSHEEIIEAPEFDPNSAVNEVYESRLYDYYGHAKYWGGERRPEKPSSEPPQG